MRNESRLKQAGENSEIINEGESKMLKKMKKILTVILALSVVMSMLCGTAFAEQGSANSTDPYVYYYNECHIIESPHKLKAVKLDGSNDERTNPWMWFFRLDETDGDTSLKNSDDSPNFGAAQAYCCDEETYLKTKVAYKRVNLEDSTYYDDETAEKIRGIFKYGYWYSAEGWNSENAQTLANTWLKEEGYTEEKLTKEGYNKDGIVGLTEAEAFTATQAAIWSCANGRTSNETLYYNYWKTDNEWLTKNVVVPIQYSTEADNTINKEGHNTESNINLFIKYLMGQKSEQATKILFSDNYFVTSEIAFADEQDTTEGAETKYDITVNFKLSGDVDTNDCLTLTATLGSKNDNYSLTSNKSDPSYKNIEPDSEGYYSISFTNVTMEDAQKGVSLSLSGTQKVNDVYFYQPLPAKESATITTDEGVDRDSDSVRDTSQNLVGKATGETTVYAEKNIKIEFGDDEGLLKKYDKSNPIDGNTVEDGTAIISVDGVSYKALAGAVFSLYAVPKEKTADGTALDSADYILVKKDLTTDSEGQISVTGLNHNKYDYFFKETDAPNGYNLDSTYHSVVWETPTETADGKTENKTGTVAVGNTKYTGHVHYDSTTVGGGSAETSLSLTGQKTLDGVPCGGYSFTMQSEDGKEIATVKSDTNGVITFPAQTYKEEGKYTYRIFEAEGSEDVIYDNAVYTVTVDVAKAGDKLIATASIYNNNNKVEQIIFENKTNTNDEEENGNDETIGGSDFGDRGTGNNDNDTTVSGSEVPKTGDMFMMWLALAVLSAAALVCTHIADRRKQSR